MSEKDNVEWLRDQERIAVGYEKKKFGAAADALEGLRAENSRLRDANTSYRTEKREVMTQAQQALLMYLETCMVNKSGRVDSTIINEEERRMIDKWRAEGFVEFGRIVLHGVTGEGGNWVRLSDDAWADAHAARIERAERMWQDKRYTTTADRREGGDDE